MLSSCPTVPIGDVVARGASEGHASRHRCAVAVAVRRANRRAACVARAARGHHQGLTAVASRTDARWRCDLAAASRASARAWAVANVAVISDGDASGDACDPAVFACEADPAPDRALPPLLRVPTAAAAMRVCSPVVAVGLLRSAFHLTDAYWAGALGPAHLSAICVNAFAVWLIQLACSVVATGVQSRVSERVGAGDDAHGIADEITQGLWGALGTYLLLLSVTPLVPALYASGLGLETGTQAYALGRAHLQAMLVGSFGLAVGNVLEAAFRGLGKTSSSLKVVAVAVAAAAALDPALMFGWGAFPRCGVAGAAIGASLAALLGAGMHLVALRRACGVTLRFAPPRRREIKKMVQVGLPLASSGAVFTLVSIALGRVASGCGPHHLAAMSLGQKFEAVAFTVCEGFRFACATLVGQWRGAGELKRAKQAAGRITLLAVAATAPFAVAFFFVGADPAGIIARIAGGATADPGVVAAAALYLRWNAGALLFLAVEAVAEGAFTGAGNTFPVLVIGAACNFVRVPIAHYLAFGRGWGIAGLWATVAATQVVKALAKWWWFENRVGGAPEAREAKSDEEGDRG